SGEWAHALFLACCNRSSSRIACCSCARSAAQFEYWFWTRDAGQPDAWGFVAQTSLPAWLVATQPPCPFETVPGPHGGGGGGQFCPLARLRWRWRAILAEAWLGCFRDPRPRALEEASQPVVRFCCRLLRVDLGRRWLLGLRLHVFRT